MTLHLEMSKNIYCLVYVQLPYHFGCNRFNVSDFAAVETFENLTVSKCLHRCENQSEAVMTASLKLQFDNLLVAFLEPHLKIESLSLSVVVFFIVRYALLKVKLLRRLNPIKFRPKGGSSCLCNIRGNIEYDFARSCNSRCSGDSESFCGGEHYASVYKSNKLNYFIILNLETICSACTT